MKYFIKSLIFFQLIIMSLIAQEIPNEFHEFKIQKEKFNAGLDWEKNSTFGPIRFSIFDSMKDSLIIKSRLGIRSLSGAIGLYGFGRFTYRSNFHGYIYSRIVNNPESFSRYSGIPRDISRLSFNSGETDNSGICYQNDWMVLQFGRGRQSWGAGNDIQLALSETSNSYDYGMIDLDFENLKVRYLHGYLESDTLFYNRYITARGIEWNNNTNFLLGLSEIVIYSGENRPIDLAYFNPISSHLEIELNDRQNNSGSDNGNGVWQCSFDYFNEKNLRISGNYIIDEFVLDEEQKNEGKGHGNGYSLKFVYSNIFNAPLLSSIYCSIVSIGTNTFKHEDGRNNFVQRNKPLGWENGSDSREAKIGVNFSSKLKKYFIEMEVGNLEIGEDNILNSPYEGYDYYYGGAFPSGKTKVETFFKTSLQLWIKPYFSILSKIKMVKPPKEEPISQFQIGFDLYLPIFTII